MGLGGGGGGGGGGGLPLPTPLVVRPLKKNKKHFPIPWLIFERHVTTIDTAYDVVELILVEDLLGVPLLPGPVRHLDHPVLYRQESINESKINNSKLKIYC